MGPKSLLEEQQTIVFRVIQAEGWRLTDSGRHQLAQVVASYLTASSPQEVVESVVRNYFQDGPQVETMLEDNNPQGESYWGLHRNRFVVLAGLHGVDPAERDDVANEAISRARKFLRQFAFRGPLVAWLNRIALNVCNTWHRQRALRSARVSLLPEPAEEADAELELVWEETPEAMLLASERRAVLEATLARLLSQRDLLILRHSFIETQYVDPQTQQPHPWRDQDIARLVGLAPGSIPKTRERILARLSGSDELRAIVEELF